jgi:hypothetical protein
MAKSDSPGGHFQPTIIRPFTDQVFSLIKEHVKVVRARCREHFLNDADNSPKGPFYRWREHNNPLLQMLHQRPDLIVKASRAFGEPVMPSYAFLAMYSSQGICPVHRDRPQCKYTIGLCVSQDKPWPIYLEDSSTGIFDEFVLDEGEAVLYSGSDQRHYRKPMIQNGGTFCDVALFHMVPIGFSGDLS